MYHNSTDRKRKPKAKSYTLELYTGKGFNPTKYIEYEGVNGLLRWQDGKYYHRPPSDDIMKHVDCSKVDKSGDCCGHCMSIKEFLNTFNNGVMPKIETLKGD